MSNEPNMDEMAKLMELLGGSDFELLVRRFAMASEGINRAHAKQALLLFVAKKLDETLKATKGKHEL